jgi:hypothetical protein
LKSEKQDFCSICRQQSVKEVAFPEKKRKESVKQVTKSRDKLKTTEV